MGRLIEPALLELPLQSKHQQMIRSRRSHVREPTASRGTDPAKTGQVLPVEYSIRSPEVRTLQRIVHIPSKNESRSLEEAPLLRERKLRPRQPWGFDNVAPHRTGRECCRILER